MQLLRKSEPAACNLRDDYRQTGNDMLMAPLPTAVADNIVMCREKGAGRGSRLCILERHNWHVKRQPRYNCIVLPKSS